MFLRRRLEMTEEPKPINREKLTSLRQTIKKQFEILNQELTNVNNEQQRRVADLNALRGKLEVLDVLLGVG